MTDMKEQQICIKFSTTVVETHKMLKVAFRDNALGQTQGFKRFMYVS
jgi:hypothetical protein